jgi:hypothetical protein
MSIFNFAHGGVSHASETETIAHEGSDSTLWIVLGSVVMAAVLYAVIRLLSQRQTQEQESEQEQDN